jgi:phosphate transport system substrate-binding protein
MTIILRALIRGSVMGILGTLLCTSVYAQNIVGAGATFPYPVYSRWAQAYQRETGININYQAIGSGGGIRQIKEKTVTFGASDSPLKPDELKQAGLVQFPMIMGGVVPVVNLQGIQPGQLRLDGEILAQIYLGEIDSWDDDAIKALNPTLKLPDTAIAPIYRSDGSGTNFLFTNYLTQVSNDFKEQVGSSTSVQWPVGIGARGNEGVAAVTGQTRGAIGYVEYAYAKQNKMTTAVMRNKDGQWVEPKIETFQAAAASADWSQNPGYYVILTNQPGSQSWPITGASFILMHRQPQDPAAARSALQFFDWVYKKGGDMAKELDYVPMPQNVVQQVQQTWSMEFTQVGGQPLWTGDRQ